MNDDRQTLARECAVFTGYLVKTAPTPLVVARYTDAHDQPALALAPAPDERALLSLARRSPTAARLADSYARLFAPTGTLRRKLVLLFAILETTPPTHRMITRARAQSLPMALLHLAAVGAAALLNTAVAVPVVAWTRWRHRGDAS